MPGGTWPTTSIIAPLLGQLYSCSTGCGTGCAPSHARSCPAGCWRVRWPPDLLKSQTWRSACRACWPPLHTSCSADSFCAWCSEFRVQGGGGSVLRCLHASSVPPASHAHAPQCSAPRCGAAYQTPAQLDRLLLSLLLLQHLRWPGPHCLTLLLIWPLPVDVLVNTKN